MDHEWDLGQSQQLPGIGESVVDTLARTAPQPQAVAVELAAKHFPVAPETEALARDKFKGLAPEPQEGQQLFDRQLFDRQLFDHGDGTASAVNRKSYESGGFAVEELSIFTGPKGSIGAQSVTDIPANDDGRGMSAEDREKFAKLLAGFETESERHLDKFERMFARPGFGQIMQQADAMLTNLFVQPFQTGSGWE